MTVRAFVMTRLMGMLAALGLLLSGAAAGQTYVRPSKGKVITVLPSQAFNGSAPEFVSALYDWTAFDGVQVVVVSDRATTLCQYTPTISIQGAEVVSAPLVSSVDVPYVSVQVPATGGGTSGGTAYAYSTGNLPPYIRFIVDDGTIPVGAGAQTCSFTIYANPLPFSPVHMVIGQTRQGTQPGAFSYPVVVGGIGAASSGIQSLQLDGSGNLRAVITTGATTIGAAASTATAYTNPALPVAQRPTTVATAPTGGNLTAATATSVFSSTAGICQVAVSNLSASIAMTCGQTNAVSLTKGLYVPPLGTYTSSQWYGGDVYCFPASGTPAFSTQSTACP